MKELQETNLTLAELSRITGIDASVIGKIKRGKKKGNPGTRAKILKALREQKGRR